MQRYIEQLIEDLHKATWNLKPPHQLWDESGANPDDELELEDISYVEKYVYGDKIPVSTIIGIDKEQLLPAEKLNEKQQTLLSAELEKLLQYFHFYLDFPENYPHHLRYAFIRSFWSEEQVPLSFGENHIEFCNYDEENCPFPGYCQTCKEVAEEMKSDKQLENIDSFASQDILPESFLPTAAEIEAWAKNRGIDVEDKELDDIFDVSENNDPFPDFIKGGFFNDDGTPIDLDSIPVPSLCIICKSYHDEDQEENFLCMMNRNDQRNDTDFICGAFEKI